MELIQPGHFFRVKTTIPRISSNPLSKNCFFASSIDPPVVKTSSTMSKLVQAEEV
jgi:hypothetical protein